MLRLQTPRASRTWFDGRTIDGRRERTRSPIVHSIRHHHARSGCCLWPWPSASALCKSDGRRRRQKWAPSPPSSSSSARAATRRPKRRRRSLRPTDSSSCVLRRRRRRRGRQRLIRRRRRLQKAKKPRRRIWQFLDEGPRATVKMTVTTEVRYCKDRYSTYTAHCVWGHPYMTSATFWDFFTPSPLSAFGTDSVCTKSRNLPYYIFFWANPPSPLIADVIYGCPLSAVTVTLLINC